MSNIPEVIIGIGIALAISIPMSLYVVSEPRWLVVIWEVFKSPIYWYRERRLRRP